MSNTASVNNDGVDYKPTYFRSGDHVVSSVVPSPIRAIIDLRKRGWENNLGELAQLVIEKQIDLHKETQHQAQRRAVTHTSLLEHSALKIANSLTGAPEEIQAVLGIPAPLAVKAIWESETLPYSAFRILKRAIEAEDTETIECLGASTFRDRDIDEWILTNERTLRDERHDDWRRGLVDWSQHADSIFSVDSKVTPTACILPRTNMSGYTLLDELRPSSIAVHPTFEAFEKAFSMVSGDVLRGLDWSNIFVAGGIVLSSLLTAQGSGDKEYLDSDIDVYIYGLGPLEANEKVKHIFDVWKGNLPQHAKGCTLVVRNSLTITFFSKYPIKRVQIVLKLVKNPKEVLLNFDLDACSMGYDGSSLVLLPRAARALETGYSIFTMDMVQGHYLGQRRATQESRVFKYADRGFGIRILPSYIDGAHRVFATSGADVSSSVPIPQDLNAIAERAAKWTQKCINRYLSYNHGDHQRGASGKVEFTHSMLEEHSHTSSEPGERSCLTAFEWLMRHVELWREKVKGNIAISKDTWAMNNYNVGPTGYDDSPVYSWDAQFDLDELKSTLQSYNNKETSAFYSNIDLLIESGHDDSFAFSSIQEARRVIWADNVSGVLTPANGILLLTFVAPGFAKFANDLIKTSLEAHALPGSSKGSPIEVMQTYELDPRKFDAVRVHEIMWSFYRSHNELRMPPEDMTRKFFTEVSRRTIRPTPVDEYSAFARWIGRVPPHIGYSYGGLGQGFFGWSDSEENDTEEDSDSVFD